MKKIKVLHCIETIGSGGVERRRLSIIKHLNNDLYEHKIICTKAIYNLPNVFRDLGVEVIEIGQFSYPVQFEKIKSVLKVIKYFKPDIIHGAIFEGITMAVVAGSLGKVPIRIAEETSDPQNRSRKATYLLRMLLKFATNVVAISPSVYSYLKDNAGVKVDRLKLINNGVSEPRCVSTEEINGLRERLGVRPTDVVIGSVGRLINHHKRFTDLLEAISLLGEDNKNIKIIIVGEGPDKEFISKFAKEKGISEKLIMVGFQADTAPYFAIMDIFSIASRMEGFGLVAAEAMYHKLPVVASKVGGLQSVVLNNETGYLVPPYSPDQIAIALKKLIQNRTLISQFGEAGYCRVKNEYSAERYVNDVEAMYKEALKQKGITQ